MIRKKLMKHFKLRNIVKTMVLATAVICGLTAEAGTAKAAITATPTPTPFPKVNVVFSFNNYETDDWDYKTEYYTSIYSYSRKFADNESNAQKESNFITSNPSGLFMREVEQGTDQCSRYFMDFSLINSTYVFKHTASNQTDTYLLCKSEEGKDKGYTKEISFDLTEKEYTIDGTRYEAVINKEYKGIHLGIPSYYIFLDRKQDKVGYNLSGKDIILNKRTFTNLFGEDNAEYTGTIYTVTDINSNTYMKFVTDLRMTKPSNMNTNGIWTTPEQVYLDGKKDDAYEVIGIGYSAIPNDTIEKVNISKNIRFIESNAFDTKKNLKEVNFEAPENITYIGERAFSNSEIEKIDLTGLLRSEDGCSVLSRSAFENCNNLKTVILDNSGKEVEQAYLPSRLFKNCSILSDVEWGNIKNIQIGDEAFFRTRIKDIVFSAEQKVQIGQYAFKNCSNIENVEIAGECEIQEGAFWGCFKNKEGSVTFGTSVELDGYAFANCTNLTTVDFASEKQSKYSSYITATPIPTATVAPTATPVVTTIPSITATPEPTKIPVNLGYGETPDNYLATHPSWYEDVYKKNPDGFAFITATPTPNPNVTITPTPVPVEDVHKGDTVTLYKGCFENTGITSVEINADHINLHMECFNGMPLSTLKLGGTILNTYGNLLNETDNLTDIVISSSQVLFLNDINDTCYSHYKPSYEGEKAPDDSYYQPHQINYNDSQNMGAFTMSKGYVNLIFTKDVELISGDYSGTIAHASDGLADEIICEKTQYYDKVSNIFFLNPNIRFVTGMNKNNQDYCGLKGFFHLHTDPKKSTDKTEKTVNVYGYDFDEKHSTENNIVDTNFYYPGNEQESSIEYHEGYSAYVALDGFKKYVSQCANKQFSYSSIQGTLTAEYGTGNVIVGTKFAPSNLVVTQTYNTALPNAEGYTLTPLDNEGLTTGNIVGSTGFRYSVPAGVLDDEGNFKMPESQNSNSVEIKVYHGSQEATATIKILPKDSASFEVEYPKFVVGKTLKLEDFKIKNLVFNDGETKDSTDLDELSEKYVVKVTFMDATKAPIAYMGSTENMASSYKVEKQLSKVLVTIIDNSKLKEDIFVQDEAPEELNVTLKDTEHTFYENDKCEDLKDLFDVKVTNNNGTTSENGLGKAEYTITEETLKAGENTLHFVYKNAKGETAEGVYTVKATEEYPIKFFSISTAYENIGIVENSNIDMNTFDIGMELNSGRTRKLTSEEKMAHCTIAGKIDIIAGQYSNITIQYKDAEHNIDVSSTATVLGIAKEIAKLSASEKTAVSSETPSKKWYIGDTITKDDITVIGYYNNGTEKEDDYKNYTIENPVLTSNTNKVVIYRTDKKDVKTVLEINALTPTLLRIEATYNGSKQVPEGSEINKNDLVVKAIYDKCEVVLANDEYTLEYQILNNKECTVTVWYNKMKAEFTVDGTAPVATIAPTVTTAPTVTNAPTATKAPEKSNATAQKSTATTTEKQTFTYSASNKKIKLMNTSKKTSYKTVSKKKLTIKASLTNGKVYYQIVKSGKKVSSKKWKTLNGSVAIKSEGKMSVYIKYTLNGKTVTKKTTGFTLDTTAPKIKVAKTGKITVTDNVSGVKSIKDGKKTIKNKSTLKKGVHKITVVDKAGNKKTVKVTIK